MADINTKGNYKETEIYKKADSQTRAKIERYRKAKTEEADPFEAVPEMTADVIVQTPAELGNLQRQYIARFSEAAATLKSNISERGEKYRAQIKSMQTALTKAGKIDEAIAATRANVSRKSLNPATSRSFLAQLHPCPLPPLQPRHSLPVATMEKPCSLLQRNGSFLAPIPSPATSRAILRRTCQTS